MTTCKAESAITFNGATKHSIRFGFKGLLYARRTSGKWFAASDVGVWNPVSRDLHYKLEVGFVVWMMSATHEEFKAARPYMKARRAQLKRYDTKGSKENRRAVEADPRRAR